MPPVRGYVFDAYGTLFDVHSVVEAGREITGDPLILSQLWRQKQLECTWLRSLMAWCNRTNVPDEELGVRADVVITSLDQLPTEAT